VADRLPDVRVIAPDLRGRGRSRDLPGPYGIFGHTDDLTAVLDHLDVPAATVMGHSMGGFVTMAVVHRYRERVAGAVLVDGGLPLPVPEGLTPDEATAAILGPAYQRLTMTFADPESYRRFMRANPAFGDWNEWIADYIDYDLVGEPPNLRPSTPFEAMAEDSRSLQGAAEWLLPALGALSGFARPTPFLRAPKNLVDAEPGMYPAPWVDRWAGQFPGLDVRAVPGTNHYSLMFTAPGVAAITAAVRDVLPDGAPGGTQGPGIVQTELSDLR
jgi:pimeloyl-ACP methyl ester carboxylesterase